MKAYMRRILGIVLIIAVSLSSVIGGNRVFLLSGAPEKARAAEIGGKYVSSIVISNKSSKKDAEKELGDEYTVIDADFGKSADTHAWIGYTTTDNEDEAIRDIKAMDMLGNFNYSDYQELLKKQQEVVEDQMQAVIPAVKEFARNYDAGVSAAINMSVVLNMYYEDDSEKGMGTYLLDAGRTLNESPNDTAVLEDIKKVFLQGNDQAIQTIENILMQAMGNRLAKDGSWMTRLSAFGPDGLEKQYKQFYPDLSKKSLTKKMKEDFHDDAQMLLRELEPMRKLIREYEASDLGKAFINDDEAAEEAALAPINEEKELPEVDESMSEEEVDEAIATSYEETLETAQTGQAIIDSVVYAALKGLSYGNGDLYDFFMREDLTEKDLYPMAYLLSSGQKSLIEDVGLYGLFTAVMSGGTEETVENDEEMVRLENMVSVYEGVDRGAFKGETAITGPAMERMSTTETIGPEPLSGTLMFATFGPAFVIFLVSVFAIGLEDPKTDYYLMKAETKIESKTFWIKEKYYNTKEKIIRECNVTKTNIYKKELIDITKKYNLKISNYEADFQGLKQASFDATRRMDPLEGKAIREAMWKRVDPMINAAEKIKNIKIDKAYKPLGDKLRSIGRKAAVQRIGARIIAVVSGVVALALGVYEIYCVTSDHDEKVIYEDFDMPSYMIDRTYPEGSETITYVTYEVCTDIKGKKADLRNWKGKGKAGWMTLYTATDKNAGDPILAKDFGVRKERTASDPNLIGVVEFGSKYAYSFSDSTYLFFRPDDGTASDVEEVASATEETEETAAPVTADAASGDAADVDNTESSAFGSGTLWIIIVLGVIAVIAAGGGVYYRKRKKIE